MAEVLLRIVVGGEYVGAGLPGPYQGQRYRVVRLAWNPVSRQQVVVYDGLTGPDVGKTYACSPADFGVKFRRAEPKPVPERPVPEPSERGSGV